MATKRSATTELNHDNWNEENEPEEAGTFTKASTDVLEKRILKAAKRRLLHRDESGTASAFGTFTGFKTSPTSNSSPFSFLANTSNTCSTTTASATNVNNNNAASNGASKIPKKDVSKVTDDIKTQTPLSTSSSETLNEKGSEKAKTNSSDYYAKLKGLNESVTQWIKTHVDANPFCILTPIFRDYEKYLKEIVAKEGSTKIPHTLHSTEKTSQTVFKDNKKDVNTEKAENPSFGNSNTNAKPILAAGEWKPESPIFSNVTTNTKPVFGNTDQKTESSKSIFPHTDTASDTRKSIFGNIESNVSNKNIFGNTNTEKNPFLQKPASDGKLDEEEVKSDIKSAASTFPSPTFSFGQNSTTSNVTAGFSFGNAKPFSFGIQAVKSQDNEDKKDNENKDDEEEEPPKPEFKPVTEEGAIYEQRCKVFVKKDGSFSDRGVGMLFLKPTPNGKTQLIVRAETSLGNLLLNTLLTESIPTKRMNKNTIMLVCLPMPDSSPPPVPVLLRVKTSDTADTLLETLNKYKN